MSKDAYEKTRYEPPAVMDLGEQLTAMGAVCRDGTGPTDGACKSGFGGTASCGTGSTADDACNHGNIAGGACTDGAAGERPA